VLCLGSGGLAGLFCALCVDVLCLGFGSGARTAIGQQDLRVQLTAKWVWSCGLVVGPPSLNVHLSIC
jgi:hypothetical protein